MPGPYPLPTLAATIDENGISAPSFSDILASLTASYQSIFGSDVNLDPDTQDGQLLGVFSAIINDGNQGDIATYNNFSPATAQGAGLSSVVKINGIRRLVPSDSTVDVLIVGVAGTTITNGIVGDNLNLRTQWALPASVVIPVAGQIVETATCTTPGTVQADPGTITQIITPTQGWQTVTNPNAATPGAPVESDAQLRRRQSQSVSLPATSVIGAMTGQLLNLPGVERCKIYDNDQNSPDSNGLPPHSIAVVIEGGDAQQIANTINQTKTPGTGTYGNVTIAVVDSAGVPNTINFFNLTNLEVSVAVQLQPLAGYVDTTAQLIQQAIAAYISANDIGEPVYLSRLYTPANLAGDIAVTATGIAQIALDTLSATYNIRSLMINLHPYTPIANDIAIPFNGAAVCATTDITVTVVS